MGNVTSGTNATTTDIAEGSNLYWTQTRFDTAFGLKSTTNLAEGTNLYFTNARAQAAITG
jgi:predicted RecA/RadA family phage recombinase